MEENTEKKEIGIYWLANMSDMKHGETFEQFADRTKTECKHYPIYENNQCGLKLNYLDSFDYPSFSFSNPTNEEQKRFEDEFRKLHLQNFRNSFQVKINPYEFFIDISHASI